MASLRRVFAGRHERLQEQLSAYLDGELGEGERRRLEEHLAGCPACRARLRTLEETVRLLRALPTVPPPRSFKLTPTMIAPAPRPRWAPLFPLATAVSALLLLVVLAAEFSGTLARPAVAPAPAAAPAEVQIQREVQLEADREAAGDEEAPAATAAAAAPPAPEAVTLEAEAPRPESPPLWGLKLGLAALTLILGAITLYLRRRSAPSEREP